MRGGATLVQLRENHASAREFLELARALRRRLDPLGVPLIINDRVDIALAAGAAGVHVGQNDLPYEDARRLLGPDAIIGLSVETLEQAMEAERWDVDYLGVSPIFSTPTKTDTLTEWGLEGLEKLARVSRHPLVAIGGIHPGNVEAVIPAPADGVAVVSAICSAEDPAAAARALRTRVEAVRSRRRRPVPVGEGGDDLEHVENAG